MMRPRILLVEFAKSVFVRFTAVRGKRGPAWNGINGEDTRLDFHGNPSLSFPPECLKQAPTLISSWMRSAAMTTLRYGPFDCIT